MLILYINFPFFYSTMTVKKTGPLLKKLRDLFKNSKFISDPLQAYIVPHGDAHQVCVNMY